MHSQSKCFFFGPISSSVVALHTDLAKPCPAKLCRAANSLSCIVWPAIANDSSSISAARLSLSVVLPSDKLPTQVGFNESNRKKFLIDRLETDLRTILHVKIFFPNLNESLRRVTNPNSQLTSTVKDCRLSLPASSLSPTFLIIIVMTAMKKHSTQYTHAHALLITVQ